MNALNIRKITALLLAAWTAASVLTACGESAATPKETTVQTASGAAPETTTAEPAPGDALPERDFNGEAFHILCRVEEPFTNEMGVDSQTGDVIDDAVYERNAFVEERLNVKIDPVKIEGDAWNHFPDFLNLLNNSIMAGDNAYQLAAAYTYRMAASSISGSFVDWYTVPYIDLEAPWWSDGFLDAASINNHSYVITGDLSYMYLEFVFALFYNKQLAESFGIGSLYDTVRNGEWTLAKLNETIKGTAADLDGNGVMDHLDRWGFVTGRSTRIDCFLYSFEVPLTGRDEKGIPFLCGVTEKYQSVIEALARMLYEDGDGFLDMQNDKHTMFEDGNTLFMPNRLYDAIAFRALDTDFGIIPYPKWDEAQEDYHTYYSDNCSCFVIPVTVPDLEFVGIVTELMAAKSYEYVRPAVYDVALKTKYSRDDESAEMIDMILDTMIYDFSNIYAYAFGDQKSPAHSLRMLLRQNSTDLSSYFAGYESLYAQTMEDLISAVTGESR